MSKPASEATQLRRALSQIRQLEKQLQITTNMVNLHRHRADKHEAEVVEWRARFDQLLAMTRQPRNDTGGPSAFTG